MSSLQCLRRLINERLTAAAEDIFTHVERIVVEYEEEVTRQRKLLEILSKPRLKLQRIELPLKDVLQEEEEVLPEQQLRERNSSLDQGEPEFLQIKAEEIYISQEQLEVKQEADTFMLTPDNEESDHMGPEPDTDHQLLSPVAESQDQTGSKNVEMTIVESKEEKDRQRRLMKILWKPEVKLQKIELPQEKVSMEQEVFTEQQFCIQKRKSSLDQEEPESLQIKEEEEELCTSQEQLEVKQEADTFMLTLDSEESDHMEPEPDTDHPVVSQTVHMRTVGGKRPHICNICQRCFRRRYNLRAHMTSHPDEKPFSCETCGKCFKSRKSLQRHTKLHTGKKPFICNICNTCYDSAFHLACHHLIHTRHQWQVISMDSVVVKTQTDSH